MHFFRLVATRNHANICAIFRISWPYLKLINIRKNCTLKSSASNFYFHDLLQWTDEYQSNIRDNLLFLPNFINEHEEQLLIDEVQRRLKTMRYENAHWDDAIVNYREIEKSTWENENAKIIEKIRRTAFTADADHQERVHVLDLEKTGWIKPHVDSIRYCGDVVAGLCLLSDAVMRFRNVKNSNQIVDLLVERRGLYIMRRMDVRNRREFVKQILKIQSTPEFVRNVCLMAHVDHGKTTLADSLISANGIISQKMIGTLRYMDSLAEEQQRGITMKSNDSFLINLVDSPGHVDFSGEVCAAAVLCDGAVVLIDVIEGVCPQTSASLRLAWKEGLKPCIVLNKIDRLFVEYRMNPMDAYRRLVQVLEQANAVAGELFVSREIEKEDFLSRRRRSMSRSSLRKSESAEEMLYFMPETGNVVFASALDNWGFRLRDFARFWSKRLQTEEELLLQALWGDYYIDSKTKLPVFGASDKGKNPLFVVMILNNLSAIYDAMIINAEKGRIEKILNSLQLDVVGKEFAKSDSRQRLQIVMSRWLPLAECVLGMVCELLPSPKHLDNDRIERIMCGDRFAHCDCLEPKARAMKPLFKECSMEVDCATTLFISKMIAVEEDLLRGKNKFMLPNSVECNYWLQAADKVEPSTGQCVFLGFARIFTGNLFSGDVLHWIPDYAMVQSGNATLREITIGQLYVMMGREFEAVDQVCAGNLVCIGGVQDLVARTATLSTDFNCPPLCDSGFYAKPIVQVSVEPKNTRDLPALVRGLKMLNLADGCVQALVEDSGEHVLTAVGEIHLHRCIKDLCDRFANGIDLVISDPVVPFNETIVPVTPAVVDSTNETTTTTSTQSEKVDRSITVTTAGRTITIVTEAVPLPEPIQQVRQPHPSTILEENEPLIAMIDPVTNRIDVTGNTAGRLASIRDGFDEIREQLVNVCSNLGKQWSNIVQRLWAFGPRRAVVNLLLNDIDDYVRPNFFDILLDQHFDSRTGLRQYDQSIVAGFHICCKAGPICEEPIRGVAFLVKSWDSVDNVDCMESIFGPLSGQLIVAMKEGCREAFQAQPQRLMLPMYTCIIQATGDVLGRVYSVLHRRSGKVINEEMKEGTNLFQIVASIPVVECFGFADDLRKRASGLAWPQLVFSHWEVLTMDPFRLPTADDEISHHGEKVEWENSAMRYVNMIRKRKGLSVNEKIVQHAEKQRTRAKKIFSVNAFLDNDVIKEPAVVCDHDRIMFTFETKNPFTGHVFVKGKYDDPNCRQDFLDNKSNGATVSIRIPQCGMRRIRQLQPQATSYSVTFIVNFHPEFITKFDKAFNVRCFYSQQDKIVTAQLEVSMVPTQFLDSTTTLTPNCQYSVRAGSVNGPVVRYIKVGDVLVHRWDCDNPDFGMLVKNCYVSDGVGRSVRILDETGCPTFSPGIQGNLNYDASLNTASVKVWAYKFPDRADLFFQCQIQICNKQSNECAAITPPHCPVASESNWTESQLSTTTSESVTYVIGSFEQPENEKMEIPHLPGYGRRSRAVDWDRPSGIELDNLTQQLHSTLKEVEFVASKTADNLTSSNSKRFLSEKDEYAFRKENDITFSVATDMVYIADKDDTNNYPSESTEKSSATCFSRTAFAMLLYSYTMLIIVVLLLTCKLGGFLNACSKRTIHSKTVR
ncbi:Elongation factor Tu GTP-binding domain-containing protein 1 [Trichinella britovi]|uniref:Elongation factor-like 1 n=1 Tax=Trichinella britovi TaxID=45882 RepID=A0A0V1D503_TRIBR|nr:Elongation factor Tu GTP-binding domain-containing protein 1 [Trichinella britovi]